MKMFSVVLASCVCLVACGGGGTGGANSSGGTFPSVSDYQFVGFDENNASELVELSLEGVGVSGSAGDIDSSADSASGVAAIVLAQDLMREYFVGSELSSRFDTRARKASCTDSGMMTISNEGSLAEAGDWLLISFDQCERDGALLDGVMHISVGAQSIVASEMAAEFNSLRVTQFARTSTLSGDLRISWFRNGTLLSSSMSSHQLNMHDTENGHTVISDLQIERGSDSFTNSDTLNISYEVASDQLNGRLMFKTPQPLLFMSNSTRPVTGLLHLTGASGSYIELNADTGQSDSVFLTVFDGSVVSAGSVIWSDLNNTGFSTLSSF